MTVNEIIMNKKISKYALAKSSGIPYMTINDICSGKSDLSSCSAKTVFRLSKALGVSMESLLEPYMISRPSFDLFKSNVCHKLKELGDIKFLIDTIESGEISEYYKRKWFPECLYLLAMVDYLSRENDIPLCEEYNQYRKMKLENILYPSSVLTAAAVAENEGVKQKAVDSSIPEFIRFNIVESEIRNVS